MKLSSLSMLLLGAGYAVAQPIRVVVISGVPQQLEPAKVSNIRFGHAVAHMNSDKPIFMHAMGGEHWNVPDGAQRVGKPKCKGAVLRMKALRLQNKFRAWLGLPLVDFHRSPHHQNGTKFAVEGEQPAHHHRFHHHGHFKKAHSFAHRLNRALMQLGPWEGRAIAFVIGCGLGVLLRMIFVLTVVTSRALCCSRAEDDEYEGEIYFEGEDEMLVAPPEYTDEKVAKA